MCGICGIYSPTGDVDERLLRDMNQVQHHRGPDSEGYATFPQVGLAVKRLKIIDLATGDQPIANEDGAVTVVYNGEIYNFPDLRKRLESNGHRFRTKSDTEVIVHLYEDKGDKFLDDLNGMFAIALWDDRQKRFLLARDRLGIKPLYYRWDGERLAFASEIKGILADPEVPRVVDPYALRDYLTFQNVFGDKTLFEGIRRLEPGTLLIGDGGRVTVRPYWDLTFHRGNGEDGFAARYGELLEESVNLQLISDVPLGSHLSGGIDSSSIVSIAAKRKEGLSTFSIRFKGSEWDEGEYIRAVAEAAGTDHHEREVDPKAFPDVFPRIMWHLDEPCFQRSVFPQYFLAELARKHVTVALTGHGGDELFAGYPAHLVAALEDAGKGAGSLADLIATFPGRLKEEGLKRVIGLPMYALAQEDLRKYGHEAVFKREELERLLSPEAPTTAQLYDPRRELDRVLARCTATTALDRILYLEVKTYLPSLLLVEDRMSMAHSLEDRVPILDHRIAELSARIPSAAKVRGFSLKDIPRRFALKRLPKKVVEHRKVGFELPIGEWFRGDLRAYVEREVLDGGLAPFALNVDVARKVVQEHMNGTDRTSEVWCLLNLAVWKRVVLDGRAPR